MKIFLFVWLASGLASCEKLDRSYLPPPGSKFSGGSPGDIQVPLEFPKESYTTVRPQDGKPDIELGINRRPLPPSGTPESQKPGFTYFQNSYAVPKTTTSYAITQTTTFAPAEDYEGLGESTGFTNGSTGIQSGLPGQSYQQQPVRRPGQGPSFDQYRPGQGQTSTIASSGTTVRPLFPGTQKGLEYLPPVSASNNRGLSPGQAISSKPQGPKYQDGQSTIQPGLTQGSNREDQYTGSQNIPSSVAPQYQDGRFLPTGPGSQQTQYQSPGSQFPFSTAAPQYQTGQRFTTPESNQQNQFSINQDFPTSTTAPQYQAGQRFAPPESNQQNQFSANQGFPSSTAAPQYQAGQRLMTPGINQQVFGARVPSQQNQYNGNQYQGNENFPSSTVLPTSGSIQQGFPSTAPPTYQNGRFTTPSQIQGGFVPSQQNQNQYVGNENFPSSTTAPQFQDGEHFSTPGYVNQGIGSSVAPAQYQNQYPGNQNFLQSTAAPQYQNGQGFSTPGPVRQNQYPGNLNFQSTAAPSYQDGERSSTPSQLVPSQQNFGSRIPSLQSQNQYIGNENFPSSTASPQYQDSQRFTTPASLLPGQQSQNVYGGNQYYPPSTVAPQYQDSQRFTTPGGYQIPNQQSQNQYSGNQNFPSSTTAPQYQNGQVFTTPASQIPNERSQYPGNQNYPSSTVAPQYQNSQRFTTPGSQHGIESPQQNQYLGSQSFPTSTAATQSQDQRFSTPGQQGLPNQVSYPGSTSAPQYQQTFAPGINQPGFIPGQQNQYQRPTYNQQIPSSTGVPQKFIPGSQAYGNDGIQTAPGTAVSSLAPQGGPPSIYGNIQQSPSQLGTGSSIYGTAPSVPSSISNQGFPSTTVGPQPARDFSSAPDFENVSQSRPERPQAEIDRNAEILNYENVLTPEGYSYGYDTSNGIHADETGTVGNGTRAQGGFSYTGDDGKVYSVFYSADENGFQPQGDHLPTSPPIPEAIQRVIDQAIKDKESGIEDDGSYNEEKYGFMKYEGTFTKLRPRNRTMSTVNGVDLPNLSQNRFGGQKNKVLRPKGSKQSSEKKIESDGTEKIESEDETEIDEPEIYEEQLGGNINENGTKRPKPFKNLTIEDNRPDSFRENKLPMNSNITSKSDSRQNYKTFDKNSLDRRPAAFEKDETVARDNVSISDVTDEQNENDESATEGTQEFDYESDLVNYKDDPNNRTDFHGLNKYLPKPKGNRKSQSGKNRPTMQVYSSQKPVVGVKESGRLENNYDQVPQDNEPDFIDRMRTRIPSRINKIGQKIKGQSRITERPVSFDNDKEINSYDHSSVDTEENGFDEDTRLSSNRMDKLGILQSKTKPPGNPKRPNLIDRPAVSENRIIKPSSDGETGYEYTSPQRKFENGGNFDFPSRTTISGKPVFSPISSQTTPRPFMTKNVYGDDNEPSDEDIDQYDAVKPDRRGRPMAGQNQQYPDSKQDDENYNPENNEEERFSATRKPVGYKTTSSRQPFGRPQTTAAPQYEGQMITNQEQYNETVTIEGSQRPGGKVFYNTNTPNRGPTGSVFSSTTLLPPSGPESGNQYQRPGQYQGRPTDASDSDTSSPRGEARPGVNGPVPGQVPSTTYRPNYSFGDRTLAPSGPVSVDGFGRPITNTNAPVFNGNLRPTYSTARLSTTQGPMGDKFKPTVGRFGVTSAPPQGTTGYQSSTSAPIGEDFSGPKQPQRFDPETGYYYK